MQLLVISVFSNQFIVGTTLHNPALVQYADFIGMLDVEFVVGWCKEHQTQVQLILDDGFGEG